MVYTKIVVLNTIYNFPIENFMIYSCLGSQILFYFIDFEIQMNLSVYIVDTKVLVTDPIYNFVVDNFLSEVI
jgi:hypothetical protein